MQLNQADELDAYDSIVRTQHLPKFAPQWRIYLHYGSDALAKIEVTMIAICIPYSHYVIRITTGNCQNSIHSAQQDALILYVIEQLNNQVVNCTKINLENKSVNDTLTAELERYKEQIKILKEGQNVDLTSKDNVLDSCAQSVEIDLLKQTLSEHLKKRNRYANGYSLKK
ncbi:hypothetical protein Tco_0228069 [Tanacetum coccineum]